MLRKKLLIITTLLCIIIPVYGFAFDATGMWDYSASGLSHDCPVTPDVIGPPGEVGILQQPDSSFIIKYGDASAKGIVSGGNTYTFSDTYCDEYWYEGEWVDVTITSIISLTLSQTDGSGTVEFTVYYSGGSCSGSHNLNVTKQSQAPFVYDASGKWNFTQYGFDDHCYDIDPPPQNGYLEVTQTGNKITAVDNLGQQYYGFVNGREYAVIRSFEPSEGGRTSVWSTVTLSSDKQGAGEVGLVWDNDCIDCWADWQISMSKEEVKPQYYTITASASAGGTITPSGGVTVVAGESQGFQITPASGYTISDVLVDNSSVGSVSSYTFSNVSADHTISVVFKRIPFLSFLSLLLE